MFSLTSRDPPETTRDPQWGPLEGARGLACAPKLHTVGPRDPPETVKDPGETLKRAKMDHKMDFGDLPKTAKRTV